MKKGTNSYINSTSIVVEAPPCHITIGDNVAIGHFCHLSTKMHKTINHLESFSGDIIIEDNVWIGNNVVIYPNVTIGHHSVIGHSCTITRSVPPYTVVRVQQEEYMNPIIHIGERTQ